MSVAFFPTSVVFFLSGIPALLYQLCWQRMLFTIYGVNIESITVVVSAFMLGLGLGSLAGGRLTRRSVLSPLLLFSGLEFAILAFGLASPLIFQWVGNVTLGASLLTTALLSFTLVVFPTVLMGASLPLLVAHLLRQSNNVGWAVGLLYFVNTLGSASACFLATWLTFPRWGLSGTIHLAGLLNGLVATGALLVYVKGARASSPESAPPATHEVVRKPPALSTISAAQENRPESDHPDAVQALVPFRLVLVLAALSGFISLSYEIVLARAYSFVAQGRASAFPLLLGWYLLGIALGSLLSGIYCSRSTARRSAQLRTIGVYFLVVNVLGYLTIPLLAHWVQSAPFEATYPLAALLSGGLGATLPLVTHVGILPNQGAAERLSYVYVANIVGSTAGSLLTGFLAMNFLGLTDLVLALAVLGTLLAVSLLLPGASTSRRLQVITLGLLTIALMISTRSLSFDHIYERLLYKDRYSKAKEPFRYLIENRSGVVTVTTGGMVFGGGIYDGQLSTDPVYDKNSIVRPYIISAFHPRPARVLVIGLSTGAWAQVLVAHPDLEQLTAIEINPGYLEVIRQSKPVESLLSNPKFRVVIDDGRRWLTHHPEEKFDLIVMNTTYHWHAYAANLLSEEFLGAIKAHLNPDGLAVYNTTSSPEAQRTGALVFPYALRFLNNMYVSPSPLIADAAHLEAILVDYEIDQRKVFDLKDPHHRGRLQHIIGLLGHFTSPPELEGFEKRADLLARTQGARVITDDNMGTEWTFDFSESRR